MGSAISSSAKPGSSGSCSSSSIIEYPELEWAVVSSDESSRSHVLRLAASSLPLYPLDGQHCKRERVVGSKGVVLLLHGYQSHARFSWLRRWTPPLPAKRDPRVFGYLPHEQINHTDTKKTKENKKIKETEETPETKETKETVKTAGEKETGDPNAPDGSSAAASPSANGCGSCLGCMGSPQYSGSFIEALNALGFLVAALDAQSQGLSEGWQGRRGGMRHIDDLAEDILQFIHVIRRLLFLLQQGDKGDEGDKGDKGDKEPQDALDCLLGDTKIPFFLVGSSLGGWAAARAVEKLRDSQAVACAIPAVSKNADDTRFMAETEHRKKDLLYIHQGTRARTALEMLSNAEVHWQTRRCWPSTPCPLRCTTALPASQTGTSFSEECCSGCSNIPVSLECMRGAAGKDSGRNSLQIHPLSFLEFLSARPTCVCLLSRRSFPQASRLSLQGHAEQQTETILAALASHFNSGDIRAVNHYAILNALELVFEDLCFSESLLHLLACSLSSSLLF